MATGAPGTNGVWQYGEDDSEATFSALLNKVASTADSSIGADRTRISDLEALPAAGTVLVKSQTVGTGVSAVTITSAFSATYNSYRIIYTGGVGSGTNYLRLSMGSTATGYYGAFSGVNFNGATASLASDNNGASWVYAGAVTTTRCFLDLNVHSPFLTTRTSMNGHNVTATAGYTYSGYLDTATSYTDFTITAPAGTFTGGTIYVYGMKK